MLKTSLFVKVITIILIVFLVLFISKFVDSHAEKKFMSKIEQSIISGKNNFPLSSVTDFDWDTAYITTYIDGSFEKCDPKAFLKKYEISYNAFDLLSFPYLGANKCSSFLIFVSQKRVEQILFLLSEDILVDKTLYTFMRRPMPSQEFNSETYVRFSDKKDSSDPYTEKLGANQRSTIEFYNR